MNQLDTDRTRHCSLTVAILFLIWSVPLAAAEKNVESGQYFVTQSWSQEKNFQRPYYVNVPQRVGEQKLPVLIFLHGNGGTGKGAMNGFLRRHRTLANKYITIFPDGYLRSWNIVSERSKADDRGFIETIIGTMSEYGNVQADNFTIMGSSNGSALVNQLLIECKLPNVRSYVAIVSPLNVFQHDGQNFKAKGRNNEYQKSTTPRTGKRIMNVSGTEDRLVPYQGGFSRAIPAKGGKLGFVNAEESIFLWAKAMGYQGKKLARPSRVVGNLQIFSYLNGSVVHYKAVGEGHGAGRVVNEEMLLRFLENK